MATLVRPPRMTNRLTWSEVRYRYPGTPLAAALGNAQEAELLSYELGVNRTKPDGYEQLGSGAYRTAYWSPDRQTVYKVDHNNRSYETSTNQREVFNWRMLLRHPEWRQHVPPFRAYGVTYDYRRGGQLVEQHVLVIAMPFIPEAEQYYDKHNHVGVAGACLAASHLRYSDFGGRNLVAVDATTAYLRDLGNYSVMHRSGCADCNPVYNPDNYPTIQYTCACGCGRTFKDSQV